MKDLKKSLSKISDELMKVAQKAEALAAKLDGQGKAKSSKAAAKAAPAAKATPKGKATSKSRAPRKKSANQPTAADTVYKVIARYKKGADVDRIKQKTGFDTKKVHNIVYKLKKQDKIKTEAKGVYMKA